MEAVIVPEVGSGPMFRVTLYKWVGEEETEIILPIDPIRANNWGMEILKEGCDAHETRSGEEMVSDGSDEPPRTK